MPFVLGNLFGRLSDIHACIVDEDVAAAEIGNDAFDKFAAGRRRRCLKCITAVARRRGAELLGRRLAFGLVARRNRDCRAGASEAGGHGKPKSAVAAGHDGDTVRKVKGMQAQLLVGINSASVRIDEPQ
jgi:hypothetical protein